MPKDRFRREREFRIRSAIQFERMNFGRRMHFQKSTNTLSFSCESNSEFLYPIIRELRLQRENLIEGKIVEIDLGKRGGYSGRYTCRINPTLHMINVDYSGDPTRFPARIKAACVALCRENIGGTFLISHTNGLIRILRSGNLDAPKPVAETSRNRLFVCTRPDGVDPEKWKDCEICLYAKCGYSRCYEPNPKWKEQGGICMYEHCIENMPLHLNGENSCPIFGHDCPGGKLQVLKCKELSKG